MIAGEHREQIECSHDRFGSGIDRLNGGMGLHMTDSLGSSSETRFGPLGARDICDLARGLERQGPSSE